jgi:hypothetical protein
MQVITEDERLEIHQRYWRDWADGGWGSWYPCRPNIKYNSTEEDREHVLKIMRARLAKIESRQPILAQVEYKIVKIREIKIVEDIV